MSDVIDRPVLDQEASRQEPPAHHRLRRASEPPFARRPQSVPAETLAGASEDLRQSSAHALYRHHALSALLAADRAPRCVAADRRAARLAISPSCASSISIRSTSSSASCRCSTSSSSRSRTSNSAPRSSAPSTTGSSRSGPSREPRLKASILVGQDDTRGRDRRDRALRQGRAVCADQCLAARQRAARPPPLLADLCPRRRARPAARHPCRRLWRPRADRRRLAVLLRRGAPVERAHDGGDARRASCSKACPSASRS